MLRTPLTMLKQEFQIVIPSLHKPAAAGNNNGKVDIGQCHDIYMHIYIQDGNVCIYTYLTMAIYIYIYIDNGNIYKYIYIYVYLTMTIYVYIIYIYSKRDTTLEAAMRLDREPFEIFGKMTRLQPFKELRGRG
jgi:hypothetical protein